MLLNYTIGPYLSFSYCFDGWFGGIGEGKYRCTRGKPVYPRKMLLRLLLMVYLNYVFSSRKTAKPVLENVIYMYITGMETPGFRTIYNFKIECKVLTARGFLETVNFVKS